MFSFNFPEMSEQRPNLSIILPVFNEENHLLDLFLKIKNVLENTKISFYEIIFMIHHWI